MEILQNGFTLELCPGAFPLSTDSIALAHFVKLPKNARVLDLGSGCGTLGLMLCAKDPGCTVTGLELDPAAHETAMQNAARNEVSHRLTSLCRDLTLPFPEEAGRYSVCVSNPPYFSGGPQSQTHGTARREDSCPIGSVFRAAAQALKYGGDFFLVHRPERLAELCSLGSENGLQAKRLLLLRHQADGPISLILLQFRKGAKPGLSLFEESLYGNDGSPTPYYRSLYHIQEA